MLRGLSFCHALPRCLEVLVATKGFDASATDLQASVAQEYSHHGPLSEAAIVAFLHTPLSSTLQAHRDLNRPVQQCQAL